MKATPYTKLLAAIGVIFALVGSASAQVLFNVNFDANAVGDNYKAVNASSGTNTNLLGALPDHMTGANTGGGGLQTWSATVDASHRLNMTASNTAGSGFTYIEVRNNQVTPSGAQTWFVQFDYTRLATTANYMGINFMNAAGQNMFGHVNNVLLYADAMIVGAGNPTFSIGSTSTIRFEIDRNTTVARGFVNGVAISGFNATYLASNTSGGFGGIKFDYVSNSTDFIVDNISGGIAVPEPATWALLAGGLMVLITFRRRRMA